MSLNGLFCADVLRSLNLTHFTYKYHAEWKAGVYTMLVKFKVFNAEYENVQKVQEIIKFKILRKRQNLILQRIRDLLLMRYINLRLFTYLLTYLLTYYSFLPVLDTVALN